MQVIHGTQPSPSSEGPVLTIGNFDGVHLGHQALIRRTVAMAQERGVLAAALTFHPAPQDVLAPHRAAPRIQSLDQRLASLSETGLGCVFVEPFTLELGQLEPGAFADRILRERIGVQGVVLGHDFRFGKGRAGDADFLKRYLSVPVDQVAAVLDGDLPISSSRIRKALLAGAVGTAKTLLGRHHRVLGQVGHGEKRGRTIGFPTANLEHLQGLIPKPGVYAARARVGSQWWSAVANIGTRPTFDGQTSSVEVHLLDFKEMLYDMPLELAFVERLRDEVRFPSVEALVEAITKDVARARELLA